MFVDAVKVQVPGVVVGWTVTSTRPWAPGAGPLRSSRRAPAATSYLRTPLAPWACETLEPSELKDVDVQRTMLYAKLHRVTVNQADMNYVGSVTIDRTLLEASGMLPGERVDVVDVTNGSRLTTYVIEGEAGSGQICINGAAAHLIAPGDIAIIISYAQMDEMEAQTFVPRVVFVDHDNRIIEISGDPGSVPGGVGLESSGKSRNHS